MFEFFANLFGYILKYLYEFVANYGIAIILFTIVIKIILLPLSIKQHKTMKMSAKMKRKMDVLKVKYKNDQEKMNKEIMELYKSENMSPFSGCLTAIVQMILVLSIFYMVRSPITYVKKIPAENIETYKTQLQENGKEYNATYPEMSLIKEYEFLKEKNPEDPYVEQLNMNMNFLGLDLNKVPQQNMADFTVYIIPALYIVSSFISIRMTTSMQEQSKSKEASPVIDGSTGKELVVKEENEIDTMAQTNKMMSWMFPIMSISIAFIAPLGLALYWLMNNILMIAERLLLNKFIKSEEEA